MKSKPLIILLVLAVIGFGYYFFVRGGNSSDSTVQLLVQEDTTGGLGEASILTALSRLKTIRFSESVFNDERFIRLVDNSVILETQPVGRTNPFSAIGADAPLTSSNLSQPTVVEDISSSENNEEGLPSDLNILLDDILNVETSGN